MLNRGAGENLCGIIVPRQGEVTAVEQGLTRLRIVQKREIAGGIGKDIADERIFPGLLRQRESGLDQKGQETGRMTCRGQNHAMPFVHASDLIGFGHRKNRAAADQGGDQMRE